MYTTGTTLAREKMKKMTKSLITMTKKVLDVLELLLIIKKLLGIITDGDLRRSTRNVINYLI